MGSGCRHGLYSSAGELATPGKMRKQRAALASIAREARNGVLL
jgi:hypothetical protein